MKPNKPDNFADWDLELPKTHNRVQKFNQDQKSVLPPALQEIKDKKTGTVKTAPVSSENPYLVARLKVLNGYKEWRRNEIRDMEKTGNVDNVHYDGFIADVVTAAGDVPSLAIRNRIKGI